MSVPSTDRAICVGVDRASQKVLVQPPTVEGVQPPVVPVSYLSKPPWPLSFVQLLEAASGSYVALGGIGDDEERTSEDFAQFGDLAPGVYGSNAWEGIGSAWVVSSQPTGYGTIRIGTDGTTNHHLGLRQSAVSLTAPPALWLEAKCSVSTASSRNMKVGFVDATAGLTSLFSPTYELVAISEAATAGGSLRLLGRNGGPADTTDTGFIPSAGVPFYVHIIAGGGTFAAAWIATEPAVDDEYTVQGPFILDSPNVPTGSVGPGFGVQQTSSSAVSMDVDYVRVHTVWPIASPSDLVSATA